MGRIPGSFMKALLLVVVLTACGIQEKKTEAVAEFPLAENIGVEIEVSSNYQGAKILWVNSYHTGFEWSDGIETGIRNVLQDTEIEFMIYEMDTKRNGEEEFKIEAGKQAFAVVEDFAPDLIIASDDNAQAYFVVPYLDRMNLPVVFCGVNWDASMYGYPTGNVTGMLEVDPAISLIENLRKYADGDRVGFLAPDDETNHKVVAYWNEYFFDGQIKAYLVSDFEEYKASFLQAQNEVDMLVLIALPEWKVAEAQPFIQENVKIPIGAVDTFMSPYVLITVAKVPEEQGEWAAQTALQILDGTLPSDIPVTRNRQAKLFLNLRIAEMLDIVFSPDLIRNAEIVDE